MDKFEDNKSDMKNKANDLYEKTKDAASDTYQSTKETAGYYADQVKDSVSGMYEEGRKKMNDLEGCMEDYSEELTRKIKASPLTSILIAGGIGYLLSKLMSK